MAHDIYITTKNFYLEITAYAPLDTLLVFYEIHTSISLEMSYSQSAKVERCTNPVNYSCCQSFWTLYKTDGQDDSELFVITD